MLPELPNGVNQTFAQAKDMAGRVETMAQTVCGQSMTGLVDRLTAAEAQLLTSMRGFAAGFSEMRTYATASGAAEDKSVEEAVGGVCRLMREAADGTMYNRLIEHLEKMLDHLGANGNTPRCDLLAEDSTVFQELLEHLNRAIDELEALAGKLNDAFKLLTDKVSQLMMMLGTALSPMNALSECFAAAAVYNPEVKASYDALSDLQGQMANGTIQNQQVGEYLKRRAREQLDFQGRLNGYETDLSGFTQGLLTDAKQAFTQAKEDFLNPPPAPEVPEDDGYTDQTPSYDFSADGWDQRVGDWTWLDTNSLTLAETSSSDAGVITYRALSRSGWRGVLDLNLQSLEDHRRAAGVIVGQDHDGRWVGFVQTASNGLSKLIFDKNTLMTPVDYEAVTDNSSGLVFDAWIDIAGVELKLAADETEITVMTREIDSKDAYAILQLARNELAFVEVGLITLGRGMQFHLQKRTDD